mgnify:FL=1
MEKKFTEDIYKAFSNHNRVQLIVCLSTAKNVTDLLTRCDLSQSALSQHLKILKDCGVVLCKREGKQQIYSIKNKKVLEIASKLLTLSK